MLVNIRTDVMREHRAGHEEVQRLDSSTLRAARVSVMLQRDTTASPAEFGRLSNANYSTST